MFQELINSFVFPAPRFPEGDWNPPDLGQHDAWFASADGTRLHGWFLAARQPRATILYAHGNGEHVAWQADLLRFYRDELNCSVFAWDYRGYGRSEGTPHESGILQDAAAALNWLSQHTDQKTESLIVAGRSLGGAVAIHLASEQPVAGLVVESAFTSAPEVAAVHYPFLPVRQLMRTQLRAIDWIARYQGPLLMSHAVDDEIVPYAMGESLFAGCPSRDKEFFRIDSGGHNHPPPIEYYRRLATWLSDHAAGRVARNLFRVGP